jgi:hypothetical protein
MARAYEHVCKAEDLAETLDKFEEEVDRALQSKQQSAEFRFRLAQLHLAIADRKRTGPSGRI